MSLTDCYRIAALLLLSLLVARCQCGRVDWQRSAMSEPSVKSAADAIENALFALLVNRTAEMETSRFHPSDDPELDMTTVSCPPIKQLETNLRMIDLSMLSRS